MSAKPNRAERSKPRRARIQALQALYEADIAGHAAQEALDRIVAEEEADPEAVSLARHLIDGVVGNRSTIDAEITRAAPAWPIEQMPAVDKNLLRLAIFELLLDNRRVPPKAAINEAVEIAKTFGSDSSARFVNGVLGTIAADQEKQA